LQKRTAFDRLQHWSPDSRNSSRIQGFLRACVLHHFIDLRRRQTRHLSRLERWQQSSPPDSDPSDGTGVNPLSYAWAVSILQIALQDLRDELVGDPFLSASNATGLPSSEHSAVCEQGSRAAEVAAAEAAAARLLTWRVFIEKFISPSVQQMVQGQKFTAKEIGKRLGLSRDQVMHRVSVVRERFAYHLRRALADGCPDGDKQALFTELRDSLILGSVRLPDLLVDLPASPLESRLDAMTVFSLCSADEIPRDELIDLLISPEPSPDQHELKELWQLVMRREYQHHVSRFSETELTNRQGPRSALCAEPLELADPRTSGNGAGQSADRSRRTSGHSDIRTLQGTIEDILFAERPSIRDLQTIKKLARDNGQRDHHILQQIYHSLYALAIARAKNACDQTITSLPVPQRHYSLTHAARYPWLPEKVVKELELAVRAFNDQTET
jgi:DNA-directed RNA polymerase specialized sigma24 family protein